MAHNLSKKPHEQQFLQFPSTTLQKFYQRYLSHGTRPQTTHSTIHWVTFHIDAVSNLNSAYRNSQRKQLPVRYASQQKQDAQLVNFPLTSLNARSIPVMTGLWTYPAKCRIVPQTLWRLLLVAWHKRHPRLPLPSRDLPCQGAGIALS